MTTTDGWGAGLATCDDPQVLVAGSTHALYCDADALARQAAELTELADAVRRRTVETWFGSGARRWAELRPVLAEDIAVAAGGYELVADALRAQAGVIIRARAVALVAVRVWRQALVEEGVISVGGAPCDARAPGLGAPLPVLPRLGQAGTGAVVGRVGPGEMIGPDPTGLRTLATRLLGRARQDVAAHAERVAALLDHLSDGLPDGEFQLGDVVAGLGDWCYGLYELARLTSPVRWAFDHEGAIADVERLLAGLEQTVRTLVDDPHEANRLLLDSQTWHDEPGRWVGRVAPDALLAGAVAAPRVLDRLGALARAIDDARRLRDAPPVPRVWTSNDPLVGDLATWLDEHMPGIVKGVNVRIATHYGRTQEVDIDLGRFVVEVKDGRGQKVMAQLDAIAAKTGRVPIAYVPRIPELAWRELAVRGFLVARDEGELLRILQEFM